ncbi:SurA N-terminal domain-containing protein [Paenibacillus barcinonensis]|uniref:SurA N-terminal domain-containing protein n=1 Tax=Paenibacillus barcinonensis TaxID=198119 RepID=UPI001C127D0E|nr:SurA N-terminal domain-containing protein [Paenibacillus barcinonensis]MBU5351710.1 SurA N-terminal domain-containing protein [Paenibacillus barcinonensis]
MRIKKRSRMKRFTLVAAIFIIASSAYFAISGHTPSEDTYVAKVNGSWVTQHEFKREMQQQRARAIQYFLSTYGAQYNKDFWKTDFEGENPEQYLKQLAMKEIIRVKVELELAQNKGLISGSSHDDLMHEMKIENQRRREALASDQPIYGPEQFDEVSFMNYFTSKVRNRLKETLSVNELKPTDKKLEEHYTLVKDQLFMRENTIKFHKISVSYKHANRELDLDSNRNQVHKQTAKKVIEAVQPLLEQGGEGEMSDTVKILQNKFSSTILHHTIEEFNPHTASTYFKSQPVLYAALQNHSNAEHNSFIIDEPAQSQYVLIRTLGEQKSSDNQGYIVDQNLLWQSYLNQAYSRYILKLTSDAQIDIHSEAYQHVSIE